MAVAICGASHLGDFNLNGVPGGAICFHDDTGLNIHVDLTSASMNVYRMRDLSNIAVTGSLVAQGGSGNGNVLWSFALAQDASFFDGSSDEYAVFINGIVIGLVTIVETMAAGFSVNAQSAMQPQILGRRLATDASGIAEANIARVNGAVFNSATAQFGANLVQISGSNVNTAAAQLGANVVNLGGSAVQAASGFQKISTGTGTGQLNLSTGRIGINWADVLNPSTVVGLSGTTVLANTTGDALAALIKLRTDLIPDTPAFGVQKGGTFGPWPIVLRQLIDPTQPLTGASVTAERSLDGGAFAACVNAVLEVGSGMYKHTLAAADLNANKSVCVKYTAPGAVTEFLSLLITP